MKGFHTLAIAVLFLSISGCAVNTYSKKSGECNELRSNLIFSGGTPNARQADIQEAERPLTARTYDKNCE